MRSFVWGSALFLTLASAGGAIVWANADDLFPLEKKITVAVVLNAPGCDQEFPLGLLLTNTSGKTITRTNFTWSVRLNGHSDALETATGDTDKIIAPGQNYEICLEKPNFKMNRFIADPSNPILKNPYDEYPDSQLVYSATVDHVWADPITS